LRIGHTVSKSGDESLKTAGTHSSDLGADSSAGIRDAEEGALEVLQMPTVSSLRHRLPIQEIEMVRRNRDRDNVLQTGRWPALSHVPSKDRECRDRNHEDQKTVANGVHGYRKGSQARTHASAAALLSRHRAPSSKWATAYYHPQPTEGDAMKRGSR